jgi:gluconate 2-dehydrogenase alpha chain
MMNGVGGSIVHYGAWLRRFHPHHFHFRSYVEDRWGADAIPEDCTVANWPVTYDSLEPYFTRTERIVGIAGDDSNPFVPRSAPFPMPPLRPFRMGELFRAATEAMGLHPHPAQVGLNSVPYDGRPATTYTAWQSGFGPFNDEKWHPGYGLPSALATGNLDLRTHCRVTKVITDRDGRARGVEYINQLGERYRQEADIVILSAYTFENVRLLFLSADAKHPDGLGNNAGQLGKHFMTKMFAHVDGSFPDTVFNRHSGPAARSSMGFSAAPPSVRRTSSCRSRSAGNRCRPMCPAGGAATNSISGNGSTGAFVAFSPTRFPIAIT